MKTKTEIVDEQAGFRQRRETRDRIMNRRILIHKPREHDQPYVRSLGSLITEDGECMTVIPGIPGYTEGRR